MSKIEAGLSESGSIEGSMNFMQAFVRRARDGRSYCISELSQRTRLEHCNGLGLAVL